ncbi:MAG: tRNA lysidine(34) synthetase TilS [Fimbriimonadaceae bacterium]
MPETAAHRLALLAVELGDRPFLVALSGGADSTALFHALAVAELPIVAAHLDHEMRDESPSEVEHCRRLAESLGQGFTSGVRSVPKLAKDLGIGLEAAGRLARREFLEAERVRLGLDWIVTAHTLDDQLETLLMRLSRGTGLHGMGGIRPVADRVIRPYLEVRREATHAYCERHGLEYLSDPANRDFRFARSRIRALVAPVLSDLYPGAREAAGRLARYAREDEAFLVTLACDALEGCRELPGALAKLVCRHEEVITRSKWSALPLPLRFRCLRLAVSPLHLGSAAAEAVRGDSGSVTLEGGRIVWNKSRIRCERWSEPGLGQPLTPGSCAVGPGWRAWLDGEPGTFQAVVRSGCVTEVGPSQAGDRIAPIGMEGSKRVTRALADARIGPAARPHVPVFRGPEGPVWIPGVALSRTHVDSEHGIGAVRLNLGLDA